MNYFEIYDYELYYELSESYLIVNPDGELISIDKSDVDYIELGEELDNGNVEIIRMAISTRLEDDKRIT